jgi:hypothetical protein
MHSVGAQGDDRRRRETIQPGATSVDQEDEMTKERFESFEQFWPYYVAMHSRRSTRLIHAVGTVSGAMLTLVGAVTGTWYLLPALPVMGYGAAWPAHWFIERNNPAAFGHPLWSFRGDLRMIGTIVRGRDKTLRAVAASWLATHPEDRSAGSLPLDLAGPSSPIAAS